MDVEKGIDTVDGKVCLRKQRAKRRKILVSEQLQDFASNTTLHGLGYITRRGLTTTEKIFWLITFCISVGICLYQISKVWNKWEEAPVIVSINEELIPVSEVPFPSITICPQWKIFGNFYPYADKQRIIANGLEISIEDRKRFEDVTFLCDKDTATFQYLNILKRNYSNAEVVENIRNVTLPRITKLKNSTTCIWRNEMNQKCTMLNIVYTQEGICFNLNGLAAEEIFRQSEIQQDYPYMETYNLTKGWSMNDGYDGSTDNPYPMRGRQNGANADLTILFMDTRELLDERCNALHSGYKVFVHHPADMPQSTLYYYALVPEQTTSFAIKYSMVSTSPKLINYPVEIRRCYFAGERYLRYFKMYTENNCRMECLSNYTYNMCGCVGFYMPHNSTDRICTIQTWECMESALEELAKRETPDISLDQERCNCLPLCKNVEYDAEILKTEYKMKQFYIDVLNRSAYIVNLLANSSFSKLEMYFKSPRFVSMRRSELFGTTDFIANCGGLLGLFLGFSFLSLVEIIYFVTLRIWCTLKRDLDKEKHQQ